jgi:allantoinase
MTLPADPLDYPLRRYGMDHDLYPWSMLRDRPPVTWPGGARVALWVVPALEWFPLDMAGKPFKPPGAMATAYPDYRHYTLRDYGNRVGIFRIMRALERHAIPASVAVNAAVATRYPALLQSCVERGWEVIANGLDMDHLHHGALPEQEERDTIRRTLDVLRKASDQPVRGWLSPAKSESAATLRLLAESGVDYVCDWVNDDMPYRMATESGPLHAMPHPIDIDDHTILVQNHHSEDDFVHALCDQFDTLYREAETQGGRIMSVSLHPWVIGQPYRIGALEEALQHIMGHDGVWAARGADILDAWRSQQPAGPDR